MYELKRQQTVEAVHCSQGEFSVAKMDERVVANLLDTFYDAAV